MLPKLARAWIGLPAGHESPSGEVHLTVRQANVGNIAAMLRVGLAIGLLVILVGSRAFAGGPAEEIFAALAAQRASGENQQLLKNALELFARSKLPADERRLISGRMLDALRLVVKSPADVQMLFPAERTQVSRQILHRRYREQWTVDHGWRVRIIFERHKGADDTVISIEQL